MRKKLIYLDYAATTPLDLRVQKAMMPFLAGRFGNPSSLHQKGREVAAAVADSRQTIAELICARPEEIIFTAGGTESINLAIFGAVKAARKRGVKRPHIIISAIEHHAVLNSVEALRREGFGATVAGADGSGLVNLQELKQAVRSETVLVSVMYANNEVGTIQPIAEIGKWIKTQNLKRRAQNSAPIVFHTDACQAAGSLDLNVNKLGVDLMTVNGSKIYGPKQAGFLYARREVALEPLIYGGGQERGLRSGTENIAGITGLAKALELAQKGRARENGRLAGLQNYFITALLKIPGAELNGFNPRGASLNNSFIRLPNNINISFSGVEGEALMLYLDSYGVCVSTGSACASGHGPSHVLLAMGKPAAQAQSSIRFTLGRQTKKQDLDYVLKILPQLVEMCRKMNKIE